MHTRTEASFQKPFWDCRLCLLGEAEVSVGTSFPRQVAAWAPGAWGSRPPLSTPFPGSLLHPCWPDPPPLGAAPCPLLGCVPGASVDSKLQGRDKHTPPLALGGALSHLFTLPAGPQGSGRPVTAGTGDPTSTLILCRARHGPVEKLYTKDATSSSREALKAGLCVCVYVRVCTCVPASEASFRAAESKRGAW